MDAVSDILLNTPVFPFLWVPHSIIMSVALRSTLGIDILKIRKNFLVETQ